LIGSVLIVFENLKHLVALKLANVIPIYTVWGKNPSQKQLGNFVNDKEVPKGLCPVGKIFWRVAVEDKDISPGLKEILEKIKRERKGEQL